MIAKVNISKGGADLIFDPALIIAGKPSFSDLF
jgi:hypothetical protein